jgi:hypothetical protein
VEYVKIPYETILRSIVEREIYLLRVSLDEHGKTVERNVNRLLNMTV